MSKLGERSSKWTRAPRGSKAGREANPPPITGFGELAQPLLDRAARDEERPACSAAAPDCGKLSATNRASDRGLAQAGCSSEGRHRVSHRFVVRRLALGEGGPQERHRLWVREDRLDERDGV